MGQGGAHLECPDQVTGEAVPLNPSEHLLHVATSQNPGDIAALPNTQKQTQGGCQNEETKKLVLMKEQNKTP